ncbi:MAG: YggT family protein [Candidatus Magasanikbacteria bacterium]|jgi:uncharacterized protein YggT (Ycf19 family)|nr:YggT family protein [Candidatus Magasanikbacteria bacterium]
MDAKNSPTTKPLYRGTQVIWYFLGLIEVVLLLRFVLKFLGANAGAGFTKALYAISMPLTLPFTTVFRTTQLEGKFFEWTTLLAMVIYFVIAVGMSKLLFMGKSVSVEEAANKLEQ